MSYNKIFLGLQKQNNGMYSSLSSRNISFERISIPENISEEEQLKLLQQENIKLKETINANRPPPQPKKDSKSKMSTKSDSSNKKEKEKNIDDETTYKEPVKKFDTIMNMEELKRAFFNNDIIVFEEQIKSNQLKFYKVEYKFNSDKDGTPDFSAKNLLKGFIRSFDNYRNYFMICFRCWKNKNETKYKYDSFWIVNTNEQISNVIGNLYDDFDFTEVNDVDEFIKQIKKIDELDSDEQIYFNDYTCIGESYVH